ncbi:hypothetical protein Droror1_Dr00015288 [Drosera rotundifolia]
MVAAMETGVDGGIDGGIDGGVEVVSRVMSRWCRWCRWWCQGGGVEVVSMVVSKCGDSVDLLVAAASVLAGLKEPVVITKIDADK